MANYELMVILNPEAGEQSLKASVDGINKLLKDAKAKIVSEDVWGDKKLAYKIKGSETRKYYKRSSYKNYWRRKKNGYVYTCYKQIL